MQAPIVSVVVPAYNVALYIPFCIESVLNQSLTDIELVVVDDASTDETREVVRKWAVRDSRVRLIERSQNGGVADARNSGLAVARGTWVASLDADDWMAPHRLARLIQSAEALGADWIGDDIYVVPDGAQQPKARIMLNEPVRPRLVKPEHILNHDKPLVLGYGILKPLIRRAFLESHGIRYHPGVRHSEDILLNVACAVAGARFALVGEPMYFYRLRSSSVSKDIDPLSGFDLMEHVNQLARDLARGHSDLEAALLHRKCLNERARRYYQIVQPLKQQQMSLALKSFLADPRIWPEVIGKLAVRAHARLTGRDLLELGLLSGRVLGPDELKDFSKQLPIKPDAVTP